MSELHGEKIDIVDWSDDPAELVAHALSPARVTEVEVVDAEARSARVIVPDFQLSLAIGKEGQNARLAARLTGWRIDIRSDEAPRRRAGGYRGCPDARAMRLLGVLGGMSWTSTETYYRLLNTGVAERLGGLHSARLVLHSVDFDEIAALQHAGDWDATAEILARPRAGCAAAGAEGLLLATNTMHKVADAIEEASGLERAAHRRRHRGGRPGAGADAGGAARHRRSRWRTRSTSSGWRGTASRRSCPDPAGRADVHRIIYDELVRDVVRAGVAASATAR